MFHSATRFQFTIYVTDHETVDMHFFQVPARAVAAMGEVTVDWGDGRVTALSNTLDDTKLGEMSTDEHFWPTVKHSHQYQKEGIYTLTLNAPMGFVALAQLPYQTRSLNTALPTLTIGQTLSDGQLVATDTLPVLVHPKPGNTRTELSFVSASLLDHNPQLTYFDGAFAHCPIRTISATFFKPIHHIRSLVGTFEDTDIIRIPALLLAKATTQTDVRRTFAYCHQLQVIDNPFSHTHTLPILADGFVLGTRLDLDWCPTSRRAEFGKLPEFTTLNDPAFVFLWESRGNDEIEVLLRFIDTQTTIVGTLLIDWGDETISEVGFNNADYLAHAYAKPGIYRVQVHYRDDQPVRPFQLGWQVISMLSPLPHFWQYHDWTLWCSDRKQLESISSNLFANNPSITHLTEAFARCSALNKVDDAILNNLKELVDARDMFAHTALSSMPRSFENMAHQHGH